jgi:hypothetical protein
MNTIGLLLTDEQVGLLKRLCAAAGMHESYWQAAAQMIVTQRLDDFATATREAGAPCPACFDGRLSRAVGQDGKAKVECGDETCRFCEAVD